VVPGRVIELAVGDIRRHVAFPSISTGALGYPQFQAAEVAVAALAAGLGNARAVCRISLVAFSADSLRPLEAALAKVADAPGGGA
jgi:O-acetyl-ADP-ribose deacetylase (regulator of RNase III)